MIKAIPMILVGLTTLRVSGRPIHKLRRLIEEHHRRRLPTEGEEGLIEKLKLTVKSTGELFRNGHETIVLEGLEKTSLVSDIWSRIKATTGITEERMLELVSHGGTADEESMNQYEDLTLEDYFITDDAEVTLEFTPEFIVQIQQRGEYKVSQLPDTVGDLKDEIESHFNGLDKSKQRMLLGGTEYNDDKTFVDLRKEQSIHDLAILTIQDTDEGRRRLSDTPGGTAAPLFNLMMIVLVPLAFIVGVVLGSRSCRKSAQEFCTRI